VEWIDRYAERLKDLTDPVWLELIEDPNYRWCKHGKEYQELVRYSDRSRRDAEPRWQETEKRDLVGSGAKRLRTIS